MSCKFLDRIKHKEKREITVVVALLFFISLIFVFSLNKKTNDLKITEVCSKNKTIVYNMTGNYYDYIEIYNPTNDYLQLDDYYISDDKDELNKIQLVDYLIEPKSYLVIFVNKDKYNFGLSNHEKVFLSYDAKEVVDSVAIPNLDEDEAYGYSFVTGKWKMCNPTPGKENSFDFEKQITPTLKKPVPTLPGGFYDEPFYLELSSENDIFYTLDGSDPTINSIKYIGPIYIEDISNEENKYASIGEISTYNYEPYTTLVQKGTVLRAISINNSNEISEVLNETYFIGYNNKEGYNNIPTISLITDPNNLFDYEKGIYVKGKVYDNIKYNDNYNANVSSMPCNYNRDDDGWKRDAVIQFFDINGELKSTDEIQIKTHGNYSTASNQKSLNIYNQDTSSNSYLFNVFGTNATSLILRNGGTEDARVTKIRDVVNQKLVKERDVCIQNGILVQVFIDGEYWGVYNLQERIDKQMISSKYSIDKDNIVIMKNGEKVLDDDDSLNEDYHNLIKFVESNDLSDTSNYEELCKLIDIDSYIDYMCFEIYVSNTDALFNNFCVWKSKYIDENCIYADNKFRWILVDTDVSAGISYTNEYYIDTFTDEAANYKFPYITDTLYSNLLKNNDFKKTFTEKFIDMANGDFSYIKIEKAVNEYLGDNVDNILSSHRRFIYPEYEKERLENDISKYLEFYKYRKDCILGYLKNNIVIDDDTE